MRSPVLISPYFLVAALVASPLSASAQLVVGVTGGATIATAEGDDAPDGVDSRTSFNVGVFAEIPLTEMLSVTPGVYYVEKGAEGSSDRLQTKLNYVEIPLLLSVRLFESGTHAVSVFAGPNLAIEAQCFQEVAFQSEGVEDTGDVECEELDPPFETKEFDVGATFGAALTFYLTEKISAIAHGGLDLGLSSIDDGENDLDLKNAAWFVSAGLAWTPGS